MKPRPLKANLLGLFILAMIAGAQAAMPGQSSVSSRFEVASIKPSPQGVPGPIGVRVFPGRLTAHNATLRAIILAAYQVKPFQLVGGPDWINTARYDIEAKAEGNSPPAQVWGMLQSLLEERFKLRIRRESRELPVVYDLTVAKDGHKLKPPKEGGCTASATGLTPFTPCGSIFMSGRSADTEMNGGNISIQQLVETLSIVLGFPVNDKTGITQKFDLHLAYSPDTTGKLMLSSSPSNPSYRTIYSEIQDQLGLKLVGGKGPVDVIVIDSAEVPQSNGHRHVLR